MDKINNPSSSSTSTIHPTTIQPPYTVNFFKTTDKDDTEFMDSLVQKLKGISFIKISY